MKLIRNLSEFPASLQQGAVTIGNFDGVHRGHAALLQQLVKKAREIGGPAIVFTFEPHPAQLLYPQSVPPALTWTERKAELLAELGADAVIAYPTDRQVLALTPGEFFQQIVCDRLRSRAMVEGPNFFFGRDRSGSIDDLRELCNGIGIDLEVAQPLKVGARYVSSSWVRELVCAGQVRQTSELLTHPYRVRGEIVRGAERGTKIGYPTANLEPDSLILLPEGVYAGRAFVEGAMFGAAVNIGPNPTFGEAQVKYEVHLIDCTEMDYGLTLEVEFLDRLRDVRPFESVEMLKRQLAQDVAAVREIVSR